MSLSSTVAAPSVACISVCEQPWNSQHMPSQGGEYLPSWPYSLMWEEEECIWEEETSSLDGREEEVLVIMGGLYVSCGSS